MYFSAFYDGFLRELLKVAVQTKHFIIDIFCKPSSSSGEKTKKGAFVLLMESLINDPTLPTAIVLTPPDHEDTDYNATDHAGGVRYPLPILYLPSLHASEHGPFQQLSKSVRLQR